MKRKSKRHALTHRKKRRKGGGNKEEEQSRSAGLKSSDEYSGDGGSDRDGDLGGGFDRHEIDGDGISHVDDVVPVGDTCCSPSRRS